MEQVFEMAGVAMSHAIWSVQDGETLIPILAKLGEDGDTTMQRMMVETEEALAQAEQAMAEQSPDVQGSVLIKDGFINLETGRTDALIAEIVINSAQDHRAQFVIPYRHASHHHGFAVHRMKVVNCEGISQERLQQLGQSFFDGIESYEQGGKVWNQHYEDQPLPENHNKNAQFTEAQYRKLMKAPIITFFLVASADGKLDEKEVAYFSKVLSNPASIESPLLKKICLLAVEQFEELCAEVYSAAVDPTDELAQIRTLLDNALPEDVAKRFKVGLLKLGQQIALSSGGFLGFGKKLDNEQKKAIIALGMHLGFELAAN